MSDLAVTPLHPDTSFQYAPFLNLFGISLTVLLCLAFLVLSSRVLRYLKLFQCKIKTVLKKAQSLDD